MPTFGENSIQEFMSHMQKNPPAYSSLYHVQFNTLPKVLSPGGAPISSDFTLDDTGSLARNLSYYANEVSIPSRQITTGEQKAVGSMYRYPTSTTFSEISMQFTLPRNMLTRTFFERWMNYISNDANQYVSPYFDCVVPEVNIWKLERGGGAPVSKPGLRPGAQYNQVTAVWRLYNVFPFNLSSFSLSNAQSNIINMEVSFYYERYRFYKQGNIPGAGAFDLDGVTPPAPPTFSTATNEAIAAANAQFAGLTGTALLGNQGGFNNLNGAWGDFADNQQYGNDLA
jgi:hypothetical protein